MHQINKLKIWKSKKTTYYVNTKLSNQNLWLFKLLTIFVKITAHSGFASLKIKNYIIPCFKCTNKNDKEGRKSKMTKQECTDFNFV